MTRGQKPGFPLRRKFWRAWGGEEELLQPIFCSVLDTKPDPSFLGTPGLQLPIGGFRG